MSLQHKPTVKPSHTTYVVEKTKNGKDANWREIGAVWLHKNGKGFDVVIPEGISVSGRIVCRQRKPKPAA
jgi:hypothetical protein